jgi:hypothetical protein
VSLNLQAIKKRCERATPGPWLVERVHHAPERVGYIVPARDRHERIVETDSGCYGPNPADADFIAHAREDVPALLAEVSRLSAELERAEARVLVLDEANLHRQVDIKAIEAELADARAQRDAAESRALAARREALEEALERINEAYAFRDLHTVESMLVMVREWVRALSTPSPEVKP